MTLALIACMASNRIIGNNGRIPWREPEDRTHFKNMTTGHVVIMGRKTFESLKRADGLPDRMNIVLSHEPDSMKLIGYSSENVVVVPSVYDVLKCYADFRKDSAHKFFVIGGQKVYQAFMPWATHIYLTVRDGECSGDTYFPPINRTIFRLADEFRGVGVPHLNFQTWEANSYRISGQLTRRQSPSGLSRSEARLKWWAEKRAKEKCSS